MAGGLFDGRAFSFNIKCIVATLIVALNYWYLPARNPYVLAAMLYMPYLALAWYDYYYSCDTRMDPTIFPFGRYVYLPFKSPDYKQRYRELDTERKQIIARADAWFIWLAIAAALTYAVPRYLEQ